eukprot:s149_g25.t1
MKDAAAPHHQPLAPPDVDESSMAGTSSSESSDEEVLEIKWSMHNGVWTEQKPGINGYYKSIWNAELGRYAGEVWVWHEPTDAPWVPMSDQIPNLPENDPEDESAAESESGQEWQEQLDYQAQEMLFWDSETKVRVRSVGPTSYETYQLQNMSYLPENFNAKVKKILSHFGNPTGTWNTTKALLTHFRENECRNYAQGQMIPVSTPMFTVCKHMLVSQWAMLWPEFKDLRKEVKQDEEGVFCDCFPATALMPHLCVHKSLSQQQMTSGNGPMFVMDTLLCKVAVAKSKQTLEGYLTVDKATMCSCSPVSTFGPWGHVYLWK